ncbi:MAG: DUF2029 domain-containing protein, partial [Candidatus Omnitrophica bacterium]|nr:DUF2029 domain-containing protein [Candidatus Omnitrophota bacterium]
MAMTFSAKIIFTLRDNYRGVFAVFLAVFLISFGVYTVWRTHYSSTDFDTYYYAARDALEGVSVYNGHEGVSPYIYPPFFAYLIVPLAFLKLEIASFVWYALNLLFFFLAVLLSFKMVYAEKKTGVNRGEILPLPATLFALMVFGLFIDNISMLQVNVFVLFLALTGLYFFRKKALIPAGLFLGMAISIKIIPLLFLVYFIVKKETRMCLSIFFWMAVFSFLLPSFYIGMSGASQSIVSWAHSMLFESVSNRPGSDMLTSIFNPQNQSVTAFFSRWLIKNDFFIIHIKRMAHEYYAFLIPWTLSLREESAFYASKIFTFFIIAITLFYCFWDTKKRNGTFLNYEYSL